MQPKPRASCGLWWYRGDIGTNIDLSCGRTWDADMILGSSLVWQSPWSQVMVKAIQISMGTAAAVDPNTALEAAQPIGWHSVATGAMDPGGKLASNIFPLLPSAFLPLCVFPRRMDHPVSLSLHFFPPHISLK